MLRPENEPARPIVLDYASRRRHQMRLTRRSAAALVAAAILAIMAIFCAAQFIWIVRNHVEYSRGFCGLPAPDAREPAHQLSLCVLALGGAAVCGIKTIRIVNGNAGFPPYG